MATRQTAEAKIAAIQDKGNNTAQEVRDVLTEILNYTENLPFPQNPGVDFFHYWTDKNPVFDQMQNALHYSIKGIKGQYLNFTFRLEIRKTNNNATSNMSNNVFIFPFQQQDLKILEYLKTITTFDAPNVRFFIPFTISTGETLIDYPLSTSIFFSEKGIVFDFNNTYYIKNGSELGIATGFAVSSVTFHYPNFYLGKV
ncbi:hypothetical protein ASG31_03985 [Chryseobacterium sp. Leaf404]|uniref:hypothetical protein n=1 Tax=unclassified Chryseobacterium TaxID=2593645 RepID=UPI0006FE16A6|nr:MULTISPECIES: hypothetical protein [unclassified Chryseobacterium]KQT17907.1 hypothetical protein ASG31_03985 [Chryseobacterium sp. Leaf404]